MSPEPFSIAIAIAGAGLCTPLGLGVGTNWRRVLAAEPVVPATGQWPVATALCDYATQAPEMRFPKYAKYAGRATTCGLHAVAEAARQAKLDSRPVDPLRIAVHAATGQTGLDVEEFFPALSAAWAEDPTLDYASLGGRAARLVDPHFSLRTLANAIVALVSNELGARGPSANYVQGELATAHALRAACYDLAEDRADVAVVVACDSLVGPSPVLAYAARGALSRPTPRSVRERGVDGRRGDGLVLGEGAAALVLQRVDDTAGTRGGQPHPRVADVRTASALAASAGRGPSSLLDELRHPPSFIVARGLGTATEDASEADGLAHAIGDRVPITAFKGVTGYLGAASPLVEVVLATCALKAGIVPPAAWRHEVAHDSALAVLREPWPLPDSARSALTLFASWQDDWAGIVVDLATGRE